MVDAGEVDLMPQRGRKWYVTAEDYEQLKDIEQGDIKLAELLNEAELLRVRCARAQERLEIGER